MTRLSFFYTIMLWGLSWIAFMLPFVMGCRHFPQGYYGEDKGQTRFYEEQESYTRSGSVSSSSPQGYVQQNTEERSSEKGSNERAVSDSLYPEKIKLVGYTEKNIGDTDSEMGETKTPSAFVLGGVEWTEEEETRNEEEIEEPSFDLDTAEENPDIEEILPEDFLFMEKNRIGQNAVLQGSELREEIFLGSADRGTNSELKKAAIQGKILGLNSLNAADTPDLSIERNQSTKESVQLPSLPEETDAGEEKDWHQITLEAIELLRQEIDERMAEGKSCSSEETRLRLLLLAAGNIPDASEKIAGMDPRLQSFWEQECRGLGRFIETEEHGGKESTPLCSEMITEFQNGVAALKTGLPIAVKKSLFVKEPAVFGYYEEISPEFTPGETVNAYFELDNVICRNDTETDRYGIAILCRRELIDSLNQPVMETREKLCAEESSSRLNDIVLNLSLRLPEDLPSGTYTLKTVFLDQNSSDPEPVTEQISLQIEP